MIGWHLLVYIAIIAGAMLCALRVGKEALIALITVEAVFVSLMLNHKITFLGISSEPSEALLVAAGLGLNLVHEYFGHEAVKKSILTSATSAFFFLCALSFYSTYETTGPTCLLDASTLTIRILAASFISFVVSQNSEAFLYTKLLKSTRFKNFFLLRNYSVALIGQACDTILFGLLALLGTHESIVHFMINSYGLKILIILLATPFLLLSKTFMKPASHTHA